MRRYLGGGVRPLRPVHFSESLEPHRRQRRQITGANHALSRREFAARWNKTALLPRCHSYELSVHRHCREATKLTPRCLIDVATTRMGTKHEKTFARRSRLCRIR